MRSQLFRLFAETVGSPHRIFEMFHFTWRIAALYNGLFIAAEASTEDTVEADSAFLISGCSWEEARFVDVRSGTGHLSKRVFRHNLCRLALLNFRHFNILLTFNAGLYESIGLKYMDPSNIPTRAERLEKIIEQLQKSRADVICLQEVWFGEDAAKIIDGLKARFPYSFSALHDANGTLPMNGMDSSPACNFVDFQTFTTCLLTNCPDATTLEDYISCSFQHCFSQFVALGQECWTCLGMTGPNMAMVAASCSGSGSGPFRNMNSPGLLLLSRKEMTNRTYVDFHPGTREMIERGYLLVTDKKIGEVVCTHATNYDTPGYIEFELQAAGFTSYVQQGYFELNTLVTEFSGRDKIILLGDFNVGAALPPDIVADQPANYALMTNAFDHQPVDQCTFCNSTEIIYNGNRSSVIIDHIFYKGYKLWRSERVLDGNLVNGKPLSDHYGVIQRLKPLPKKRVDRQ